MKKNLNTRSARIARMRRWWRTIGLPSQLTILGLVVAILGLVPTYLAFFDNRGAEGSSPAAPPASTPAVAPSGVTNTSLRQPSGQGALRLDAAYNRAPESIMWATAQSLPPEDDAVIQAPNLAGNDPAQSKIAALLVKRGGVKIESDETEENREHSQVRLVVTGQHERPVLITGLRANVLRRERPLSGAIVYGPPQGAGENVQVGLDLDSRTPSARSFDDMQFLAEPYFAAHHVSVKPGEQVVFTVRAFTSKCYCEWELLVNAVVDGKDQVFSVKDGDRPFRTTAFATAYKTIYSFDFFGGNRFVKLPPGSQFPPPQSGP
jgi:hypothetical protein